MYSVEFIFFYSKLGGYVGKRSSNACPLKDWTLLHTEVMDR
jgi:hypothetical protein